MTSKVRPTLTYKGRPWEVDSGLPHDVLRMSSRRPWTRVWGMMWGHLLEVPKSFFLLFFRNLFDLSNLSKSNSILKVYLEPSWTSKMELFGEIGWWLLAVNYFRERTSSQKLDWGLNTLLILFSNVVWHAYRSIAETKIFRFGASLICPFYVKKENWIVKKLYYRKVKYVTSNTENFKLHLQ